MILCAFKTNKSRIADIASSLNESNIVLFQTTTYKRELKNLAFEDEHIAINLEKLNINNDNQQSKVKYQHFQMFLVAVKLTDKMMLRLNQKKLASSTDFKNQILPNLIENKQDN